MTLRLLGSCGLDFGFYRLRIFAPVAALKRHRDAQRVERALAGDVYDDGDLVFCDELGRLIRPKQASDAFVGHRKAAGLSAGTLHTLRHSAATLMLTRGIPIHVVAGRLGDKPETIRPTPISSPTPMSRRPSRWPR